MDELIKNSLSDFNLVNTVTIFQLVAALTTTTLLTLLLAKIYMATHSGYSYSKSYVQSLVLVGITITLIMVVIGSNIARAFALVGALSIIRFRNPIKDSKDLVFIFMAMAIGMASGTYFFTFAIIFSLFVSILLLLFHRFNFGEIEQRTYVVRVRSTPAAKDDIAEQFDGIVTRCDVLSVDRISEETDSEETVYEVNLMKHVEFGTVTTTISKVEGVESIHLIVGGSNINV